MFLLDSNAFISAARLYYHPEIAPPFWSWLKEEHRKGNIASIDMVRKEINKGVNDGDKEFLKVWANELPDSFWLSVNDSTLSSLGKVSNWLQNRKPAYKQSAIDEFFKIADYFLVAQAHSEFHHVITSELPNPESLKRVCIPDVCKGLGVEYHDPFYLYRKLGLKFENFCSS